LFVANEILNKNERRLMNKSISLGIFRRRKYGNFIDQISGDKVSVRKIPGRHSIVIFPGLEDYMPSYSLANLEARFQGDHVHLLSFEKEGLPLLYSVELDEFEGEIETVHFWVFNNYEDALEIFNDFRINNNKIERR